MSLSFPRFKNKELVFLRLATFSLGIVTLFIDQIFLGLEERTPPGYTGYFLVLSGSFFILSFFNVLKKHSYEALIIFSSLAAVAVGALVPFNNSKMEFVFDFVLTFTIVSLFFKKAEHLVAFSLASLASLAANTVYVYASFPDSTQNPYSIGFLLIICVVVFFWNYNRINYNIKVERRVEEKTRDLFIEQAKLIASIESVPAGYVMADEKGNIILVNKHFQEIFNYSYPPSNLTQIQSYFGKFYDLVTPFREVVRKGQKIENTVLTKDGLYLKVSFAPIISTYKEDQFIGVLLIIEDQTDEKMMERAKDEFFAVASHELRTPLTALKGSASILLEHYLNTVSDTQVRHLISSMYSAAERLTHLVNQFLDVSLIQQNQVRYTIENLELRVLTAEVKDKLLPNILEKGLRLEVNNSPESVSIKGDAERVKQILTNLIKNAIIYTPQGFIRIDFKKENGFWNLLVTDSGVGIAKERQDLLFRKIQALKEDFYTRETLQGSGLGLYISKLLAKGMGGDVILVSSIPSKGSTFALKLPAVN